MLLYFERVIHMAFLPPTMPSGDRSIENRIPQCQENHPRGSHGEGRGFLPGGRKHCPVLALETQVHTKMVYSLIGRVEQVQ